MIDAVSRGGLTPTTEVVTSYILLGEGDFTYSLDACRYVAVAAAASSSSSSSSTRRHYGENGDASSPPRHYHSITCTGIDTLDELRAKYRDADFVLGGIRSCSSSSSSSSFSSVTTRISHGVNAVRAEECDDVDDGSGTTTHLRSSAPPSFYDHVIFNHPHLGTEDALLHSRFLAHLFHASTGRWMKPDGGLLHLTLVIGQCERWRCLEWADRHGLVLLRRGKFVPPPPPPPPATAENHANAEGEASGRKAAGGGGGGKTYYSLRRHQSGRSFANRRRMQGDSRRGGGGGGGRGDGDSETLVFGRACDRPTPSTRDDADESTNLLLPWERDTPPSNDVLRETVLHLDELEGGAKSAIPAIEEPRSNGDDADPFPCKYCPRSFRERRSLRNHMASVHPDCDEVRSWDEEKRCATKKGKKNEKIDRKRKSSTSDDGGDGKCNEATQQSDGGATQDRGDNDDGLKGPPWTCAICDRAVLSREDGQQRVALRRIFPNEEALLAHQRAKHFGVHLDIKPDWHLRNNGDDGGSAGTNDVENDDHGGEYADPQDGSPSLVVREPETPCCTICDRQFSMGMDELRHEMEFVPSSSAIARAMVRGIAAECVTKLSPSYKCAHCSKAFGEARAQRQHENFCSFRRQGIRFVSR